MFFLFLRIVIHFMNRILLPIAWCYQGLLILRHKLFDWNILPSKAFDFPVICVGNLSLGGTGKTPHTEYLIELLSNEYPVAVLSRGYGRTTKGFRVAKASDTAATLGDEPMLYHTKHPKITVAVDEDRVEGVNRLLAEQSDKKPEIILLDDAFQHRHIKAGLNILLTEYGNLYTNDFLIPAGSLRDVRFAAKRADLIVVSKTPNDLNEMEKSNIIKKLKPLPHQKVFFSSLEYEPLIAGNTTALETDSKNADAALLFTGIANPNPLIEKIKSQYLHFDSLSYSDHHPYTEKDLQHIMKRYHDLEGSHKIIVTTEKDYARIKNSPYLCSFESVPLFVAPIHVCFDEKERFNKEILSYVRKNAHHC